MSVSTFHTHTKYCDGKNTAEEMILAAIEAGCEEIGFSGHSPLDFETGWAMKKEDAPSYLKELEALKEKYKDKIKVYIGIEQDYRSTTPTDMYEYVLGSVHHVYADGQYFEVDNSPEVTRETIEKHFDNDPYKYCEAYYSSVKDIYNKTKCQIIGHFDLVTKFNEVLPLIDTSHPRYVKAVNDALDVLLKTPAAFEINTGAISRGYRTSPYPEEWILDKIGKNGNKFVICSDTHSAKTVDFKLDEQKQMLDKKGYAYLTSMEDIKKL